MKRLPWKCRLLGHKWHMGYHSLQGLDKIVFACSRCLKIKRRTT